MTKTDFYTKLNEWKTWANTNNQYDIGLLKIWINFEKFYSEIFLIYSLGGASEDGFSPTRRLCFDEDKQFYAFVKNPNSSFIDYTKQIPALSPFIFSYNPFDIFITDSIYKPVFLEVTRIRNYIAHESAESKNKLKSLPQFSEDYIDNLNSYLMLRKNNTRESIFTYYVDRIKEMAEIISNPHATTTTTASP